ERAAERAAIRAGGRVALELFEGVHQTETGRGELSKLVVQLGAPGELAGRDDQRHRVFSESIRLVTQAFAWRCCRQAAKASRRLAPLSKPRRDRGWPRNHACCARRQSTPAPNHWRKRAASETRGCRTP